MKSGRPDKLVKKNCSTCEFNFGWICAGHSSTYGMNIEKVAVMLPNGCDDYKISFKAFMKQEKMNGR